MVGGWGGGGEIGVCAYTCVHDIIFMKACSGRNHQEDSSETQQFRLRVPCGNFVRIQYLSALPVYSPSNWTISEMQQVKGLDCHTMQFLYGLIDVNFMFITFQLLLVQWMTISTFPRRHQWSGYKLNLAGHINKTTVLRMMVEPGNYQSQYGVLFSSNSLLGEGP